MALEVAAGASAGAAGAIGEVGSAASTSAEDVQKLNDAFDELFDLAMSGDRLQIKLADSIKAVTKELTHGTRTLALNSEEGKKNRTAILDRIELLKEARDQQIKEGGATAQATAVADKSYTTNVAGLRRSALAAGFTKAAVDELIGKYRHLPSKASTTVSAPGAVTAKGQVDNLHTAAKRIKPQYSFNFQATTGPALASINEVENRLGALDGRSARVFVKAYTQPIASHAAFSRATGGVAVPMAAGGVRADIYPPSNPPLYQFAEPETGGELFLPRKGDKERGRAILAAGAEWYGMRMVPLAAGGIMAAARGLVNVQRPERGGSARGTRLDSIEAYIAARNAVASLNASLKEHGRSLSTNTARGRENRSQLDAAIRSAQEAARAKFAETDSVRAANLAYDGHIRRLRAVLAQQKVSAATRASLLKTYAGRPTYDQPDAAAPRNSSSTIAAVQAQIGAQDAIGKARSFFDASWGKPTFAVRTAFGRDNLGALFDFLAVANTAAQARYTQTGSAGLAKALYGDYLRQLRVMLAGAGMSRREISSLIQTYGRITLGNRMGGVYEHARAGVLRDAHIAAGGPTRYAYAEQATGGELFAPKYGDLAKTRAEVGWAVNNWWGGQVAWQPSRPTSQGVGQSGSLTIRVVVQDGQVANLVHVQVDEALGALASARVYQTV